MRKVMSVPRLRIFIAPLMAALLFSGCGSSDEERNQSYLARAMNLVIDSPGQAIDIGGLSFQAAFGAGTGYSSAFLASGDVEVRAFVPGAAPGEVFEDTLVLKPAESVQFEDRTAYSLITYGTVADFRTVTVARPVPAALDPDTIVMQFVHAALGAGPVDIYVTDPESDLAGATPLFTLGEGEVSDDRSIALADYQVRIAAAGTTDIVYDSGTVSQVFGGELMYVVGRSVGPSTAPVFLSQWAPQSASIPVADAGTPAFVRLLHLSPDAGSVDLYAEDDYSAPIATNAAYGELSAYGAARDTLPDGPTVVEGVDIDFSASAIDAEDGDLSDGIAWSSNIDGPLSGTGPAITNPLTAGVHAVTASVTDSGGLTGTEAVTVRVLSQNASPPDVNLTQPPSGAEIPAGGSLNFAATAEDATDGELTGSLAWSSSIDGALPDTGGNITATLSAGVHAVTASVADADGLVGSDTIVVTVTDGANLAPEVEISAPDVVGIELDLTPAGDPATLISQQTLELFNGIAYTYFAANEAASLSLFPFADPVQNVATHSILRIAHGSTLAGTIDVYITAPGAGIADASPFFTNVAPGAISPAGSLGGGIYDVSVALANTSDVVLLIPSLDLSDGQINLIAVVDDAGGTAAEFLRFTE